MFASGTGTVIAAGADNLLGNVIIVRYDDAVNHKTGKMLSVIARYYHLSKILVSPGAAVNSDTKLALYGNTGKYSAGAHLHIEFDSNVASPRTSKTLGGNSNIILASPNDTTIDPFELLYCKISTPDNQEIKVDQSKYGGQFYAMPEISAIPKI